MNDDDVLYNVFYCLMMILMDCKCNNYLQYYYKFVVFIGGICDNIKQELFTVPKGSERITHTPGQLVT